MRLIKGTNARNVIYQIMLWFFMSLGVLGFMAFGPDLDGRQRLLVSFLLLCSLGLMVVAAYAYLVVIVDRWKHRIMEKFDEQAKRTSPDNR